MVRHALIACAAVAVLGSLAGTAASATHPPVLPAVAQYIETLPTSGGAAVPTGHARTRLPSRVAEQLRNTPQDMLLRRVATSAAYGAPQHRAHVKKHVVVKARHRAPQPSRPLSRSAFSASVDAVGTDQSVVVWLVVALLLIAAFGAGAAVSRARRDAR
jgi:hypothetical protein